MPAIHTPTAFLRRFTRPRPNVERCELCSAELSDQHEHLVEPSARKLVCACTACAILFGHRGDAKYKRVPRRVEDLRDLALSDLRWESFGLPIALAFFFYSTPAGRMVAVYPSPAGATESALPVNSWEEFVEENEGLGNLEPDVDALLINRVGATRAYFRVGIDECYRIAGILRTKWSGFSGGDAVWAEIDRFFENLRHRAGSAEAESRA